MTNAPKTVTLQTAILMAVKSFAEQGTKFSAHDISKLLRDQVNTGQLEIPEVEDLSGQDGHRFNIKHPEVRSLFNQMRDNGVFSTDFNLNGQFNGMYFIYEASPVIAVNATPVTPAFTPAPANIFPPTTATTTTAAAPANGLDSKIKDRVKSYLNNCVTRNYRPSLKHVQSAIKRGPKSTGVASQDLLDYIENELGYSVVTGSDIKHTQIVTV